MSKVFLSAALAGMVVLTFSQVASARCRRYQHWGPTYWYWYSAPAAPVSAGPAPVPTMVAPAPAVAQRGGSGYTYRSFSYDPQEAPVYPPPPLAGRREVTRSEPAFFRADHKMLGTSYNN